MGNAAFGYDKPAPSDVLGNLAGYGTMARSAAAWDADERQAIVAAHLRALERIHRDKQDLYGRERIREGDPYDATPQAQVDDENRRLVELYRRQNEHVDALRLLGVRWAVKLPYDAH